MFEHILFPTDGSPASEAALLTAVEFAKSMRARMTALHVLPDFHVWSVNVEMIEDTRDQYLADTEQRGKLVLEAAQRAARDAGVDCELVLRRGDDPYKEIIALARERGCDAIAMASHGYHGMKAMLLGSVTHKVLVHSMIPVLVLRPIAE